jgi:hypothetical protein
MDCRFVYDPPTRKELSNVSGRLADGYRVVRVKDLGSEAPPGMNDPEEIVRVSDVILMCVSKQERLEMQQEKVDLAQDQMKQVDRKFHDALKSMEVEGAKTERHRPRPVGRASITEVDYEYERLQREEG